nr:exosortase U [Pirellulales bacterium]
AFHSVALYAHYASATADTGHLVERIVALDRNGMEQALKPWRVVDEELIERETISELGRFSKVYQVQHPDTGTRATVSIDFPFYRRWHDVCDCYVNSGWRQKQKKIVRSGAPREVGPCEYIRAELTREGGGDGHLVFANLNEDGLLVAPPNDLGDFGYLLNTFINKAQHARQVSLNPRKLFQVQVWHQQPTAHTDAKVAELAQLFFAAFGQLRHELRAVEPGDVGRTTVQLQERQSASLRQQPGGSASEDSPPAH